jgi:hypothetical protein
LHVSPDWLKFKNPAALVATPPEERRLSASFASSTYRSTGGLGA